MPIRWRLTLWFALILCAILVVSGIALQVLLQRYLINQIDDNLKVYSARVHGTVSPTEVPDPLDYDVIHSRLPPVNEFASPGIYIQLIDRDGHAVVKSDSLGEQELPVDPLLVQEGFNGEVTLKSVAAGDGARVRIMVSPLFMNDRILLLEVAQSLRSVDDILRDGIWTMLAGILLALTLAGVSGAVLLRRALSPVENITRTARNIGAGFDLSRRVDYHGPPDEVGRLASTFDDMIERLHRAFESQKNFVADASHELRGPLTVIRGNLDLLKRNISPEDRRESLGAIEREMTRMVKITDNLLLLAEVEAGQGSLQETVSLKAIVKGELQRVEPIAGTHNIEAGQVEDLYVNGDAHRLRQLLGNLVNNAIRYTPEGGSITISLLRDGEWARLKVADTGIGIAPEHLPHIFDRFYRADKARSRATGGTGLGLAIVRGIAEQHGGKVAVDSQPGKGSTFTVWLKL